MRRAHSFEEFAASAKSEPNDFPTEAEWLHHIDSWIYESRKFVDSTNTGYDINGFIAEHWSKFPYSPYMDNMAAARRLLHVKGFSDAGSNVYRLGRDLAENLFNTEIRGVTPADIRLPYESLLFEIPWGTIILEEDFLSDDFSPSQILVQEAETPTGRKLYANSTSSKLPDREYRGSTRTSLSITVLMTEEPKFKNLSERKLYQLVSNILLYITWEDPGEEWISPEGRKLWKRIQKTQEGTRTHTNLMRKFTQVSQRHIKLGHSKVIDRSRAESEKSVGMDTAKEDSTKIAIRTRVAGHWRRQPCGPRCSEIKVIWIAPHWRNWDGLVPARTIPTVVTSSALASA